MSIEGMKKEREEKDKLINTLTKKVETLESNLKQKQENLTLKEHEFKKLNEILATSEKEKMSHLAKMHSQD